MLGARAAPNRKCSRHPKHLMNWNRALPSWFSFFFPAWAFPALLWRQSVPVFSLNLLYNLGLVSFPTQLRSFLVNSTQVNLAWSAETLLCFPWIVLSSSNPHWPPQEVWGSNNPFKHFGKMLERPSSAGAASVNLSNSLNLKFILVWMYSLLSSLLLLSLSHQKAASASHPFGSYKPVSCL